MRSYHITDHKTGEEVILDAATAPKALSAYIADRYTVSDALSGSQALDLFDRGVLRLKLPFHQSGVVTPSLDDAGQGVGATSAPTPEPIATPEGELSCAPGEPSTESLVGDETGLTGGQSAATRKGGA
jgi:hypothetical protein